MVSRRLSRLFVIARAARQWVRGHCLYTNLISTFPYRKIKKPPLLFIFVCVCVKKKEGLLALPSRDDRENDVSTQCRLVTLDPDRESMDLSLNDDRHSGQRAIMKASHGLVLADSLCSSYTLVVMAQGGDE